jgi:hypothetical protein
LCVGSGVATTRQDEPFQWSISSRLCPLLALVANPEAHASSADATAAVPIEAGWVASRKTGIANVFQAHATGAGLAGALDKATATIPADASAAIARRITVPRRRNLVNACPT